MDAGGKSHFSTGIPVEGWKNLIEKNQNVIRKNHFHLPPGFHRIARDGKLAKCRWNPKKPSTFQPSRPFHRVARIGLRGEENAIMKPQRVRMPAGKKTSLSLLEGTKDLRVLLTRVGDCGDEEEEGNHPPPSIRGGSWPEKLKSSPAQLSSQVKSSITGTFTVQFHGIELLLVTSCTFTD